MATTVLDALRNAEINFETLGKHGFCEHPIYQIAMEQLSNAVLALENGKKPDDIIQEHIFGDVNTGGK